MWSTLPLSIRAALAGLTGTVALIAGAVTLRTPPHPALEEDAGDPRPAASAAGKLPEGSRGTGLATSAVPQGADSAARLAPSGRATAGGAAPRSSAPEPAAAPSSDAREARAELRKHLQFGRYAPATATLARLVDLDPRAAEDGEVRADIVELSMRVMLLTGGEPDQVFSLITQKMGTTGIDILYELLTTRGGSRAAGRADELLRDDAIRARGTPALRIAYDLRRTPGCDEKKTLFPRAKTDGDGRTLGQLQLLNRRCGRRTECCLQNDPDLRATMDAMKARGL